MISGYVEQPITDQRTLGEALASLLDSPMFGRWLRARLVKGAWARKYRGDHA